jgi:hypothetical protein
MGLSGKGEKGGNLGKNTMKKKRKSSRHRAVSAGLSGKRKKQNFSSHSIQYSGTSKKKDESSFASWIVGGKESLYRMCSL